MIVRCHDLGLRTNLLLVTENEEKNMITQEAINAEISYRLERAQAAGLARELRATRAKKRPSRLRRWLTRSGRSPAGRPTPALP